MAEGKSNQGIANGALHPTEAAVEKHVTNIFHKLELGPRARASTGASAPCSTYLSD